MTSNDGATGATSGRVGATMCAALIVALAQPVEAVAASRQGGGAFATSKAKKRTSTARQPATQGRKKKAVRRGRSLSGRWRMALDCNTGKYVVILHLRQTSPSTVGGTTQGLTTGKSTVIVNGRVSGSSVSFTRKGALATMYTRGTISANGRRMTGTERGPLWTCTFVASR